MHVLFNRADKEHRILQGWFSSKRHSVEGKEPPISLKLLFNQTPCVSIKPCRSESSTESGGRVAAEVRERSNGSTGSEPIGWTGNKRRIKQS